jgi:steroid delta-isomerase-like uncharacterized protein
MKGDYIKMTPKETVINYWRAWSEHNLDDLLSLLAPDFISRSSLSPRRAASKDMITKGFEMFDKALPDLKEEVISIAAEGDRVVSEVIETATFTGPMELPTGVIAPTNRSYKIHVASFFRINSQGLIVEQITYWDTTSIFKQIGIDPQLFAPNTEPSITDDVVQEFTRCMGTDDIDGIMKLFTEDSEWILMATGETFHGIDQIRELATRSVNARNHTGERGIHPFDVFTNNEGTRLCWEYVHTAIVTEDWPASKGRPTPGSEFKLSIVLVCEIQNNKIMKLREYFDMQTIVEPGVKHHLYS